MFFQLIIIIYLSIYSSIYFSFYDFVSYLKIYALVNQLMSSDTCPETEINENVFT